MKTLTLIASFVPILCMISAAAGEVSTRVCLADGNTLLPLRDPNIPFIYRDIMVGTKLTIIVSSDVNEYWGDGFGDDGGSLAVEEEYWNYGVLSARGPQIVGDWSGSHFPAAGREACVLDWEGCIDDDVKVDGFDLYTGSTEIEADNWFIIDYTATKAGICKVGFYDHTISWSDPNYYLVFYHVPTRDFNNDTKVDFADFAVLASYWQENGCGDQNWCEGTDPTVDINDLMFFVDYWLETTE